MHSFHYADGRLRCEEVDLAELAEQFGMPLYVYSAGTILDHYRRLNAALAELDHLICYAVKANFQRRSPPLARGGRRWLRHRLWR